MKLAYTFLLGLLATGPLLAGNSSGGGGTAVVCRDAGKKILSVELLDLFEGGLIAKIVRTDLPVKQQLDAISKRLSLLVYDSEGYETIRARVEAHRHLLPAGVHLDLLDDALPIIHKDGCQIEQFARYTEWGDVLVDSELASFLEQHPGGNTDLAALIVHESLYAFIRAKKTADNSKQARRVVGKLFSEATPDYEMFSLLLDTQKVTSHLVPFRTDFSPRDALLAVTFSFTTYSQAGVVHSDGRAQYKISSYDVKTGQSAVVAEGVSESEYQQIFIPATAVQDALEDGKFLQVEAKLLDHPNGYLDMKAWWPVGGFDQPIAFNSASPYGVTWFLKPWQK